MNYPISPAFADSTIFSFPGRTKEIHYPPVVRIPKPTTIQVYLLGKISDDLTVIQPLQINIEQDEDSTYLVSDDIFLVYGDSDDQASAITDYVTSLIEFYQIVEKSSATNQFDKRLFNHLRTYIQPTSARGHDDVQTNTN